MKRRRLTDGGGLYLEVAPTGSKRWFWKFYPDGKESRLALGSYPAVSLKAARLARDDAKMVRRTGANPVHKRKIEKITNKVAKETCFEADPDKTLKHRHFLTSKVKKGGSATLDRSS